MAKQPALSTQLKAANAKIVALEAKLKTATQHVEHHQKQSSDATALIEQIHQVLDAVPNSIARESEGENSWDRVKRSPVTRLAAWLAIRN